MCTLAMMVAIYVKVENVPWQEEYKRQRLRQMTHKHCRNKNGLCSMTCCLTWYLLDLTGFLRARLDCLTKPSDISHLTKF